MTDTPPRRPSKAIPVRPSGAQRAVDADELEKQAALRDVMEHAVRTTRAVANAKPMVSWRSRPIILGALAVVCASLTAYVFIARPDFVWGSDPSALPASQREAGVRLGMYFLAQRLEQYRADETSLPENLDFTNESWPGITYSLVSDSVFELRATVDSVEVVFRSDQPVDQFLGSSMQRVRRQRR